MTVDRGPFAAAVPTEDDPALRYSLEELSELLLPALDAAGVRTACEVGVEGGTFTRRLVDWLAARGGRLVGVDPAPADTVRRLAAVRPRAFTLVEAPSHQALADLEPLDAYLLDGDHNYFTVAGELRLIAGAAAAAGRTPLVAVQDVGWPTGRRDLYYAPDRLPATAVHDHDHGAVVPWSAGTGARGFRGEGHFAFATTEGGPANGVWTAVEDVGAELGGWDRLTFPCFFGLALLWPATAPWSAELRDRLGPLADHPTLARLERNRLALYLRLLDAQDVVHNERRRSADRIAHLQARLDAAEAALASRRATEIAPAG